MEFLEELGMRIQNEIKKRGLNQKDVADLININENSLVRYIKGSRAMKIDDLMNLCKVLKIDIHKLVYDNNKYTNEILIENYNEASSDIKTAVNKLLDIKEEPKEGKSSNSKIG